MSVPDRVEVIAVAGDLDLASADAFLDRVRTVLDDAIAALVVDLADVEFLDSSGIGALVAARNRALERGIPVVLRSPAPQVARILAVTGMDQVFRVEGSPSA